jgi:hypothetical protein
MNEGLRGLWAVVAIVMLALARGTAQEAETGTKAGSEAESRPSGQERTGQEGDSDSDSDSDSDFFGGLFDGPDELLDFGFDARVRGETWRGFGLNPTPLGDDEFLLSRFRYQMTVKPSDSLSFHVEGLSAFALDRSLPGGRTPEEVDELDLQQAYADVAFGFASIRPGRQQLSVGGERLVSPSLWSNTPQTFDGVSATMLVPPFPVTAFWARPVTVEKYGFNESSSNDEIYGLTLVPVLAQIYLIGRDRKAAVYNGTMGPEERFTVGGSTGFDFESTTKTGKHKTDAGFDLSIEGAYQFGSVGSQEIDAYMISGELGMNVSSDGHHVRVFGGGGYASGDDGAGGDVQTFSQLFADGHTYLGQMDVVGRQNIVDANVGATYSYEGFSVTVDGHGFWRADRHDALYNSFGMAVAPGAAGTSLEVGLELDVAVGFDVYDWLRVEGGYGHLFGGNFLRQAGLDEDVDFGFLATILKL